MFEKFEQQSQIPEQRLPKEIQEGVRETLLDWLCTLRNALSEHEAKISLAQHGGEDSREAQVCRVQKELLVRGVEFIQGLGREMGVDLL